ncbi:hypothetical protein ZWY2020_012117 [Hordeum vulgare]|nr:hypothetical protein ZWY2020_012117 [Hordeum vulgare]
MSGGIRQMLNLGLYDGHKRLYLLRRLDLSKMDLFHRTAQEAAEHGKVLPTLTPTRAHATNRRRIRSTDLTTAEAAAPKIHPPKPDVLMGPPQLSPCLEANRSVHFFPTAS